MTELAAAYITEVANGNVPGEKSPEAIAYHQWSKESAQVSGTWAEWTLVRLESEARCAR
jgi:hypothetical protein